MPTKSGLKTTLSQKTPVVDVRIIQIQDQLEGIIDVKKDEITNPRVFCDELNKIVDITEHGTPVAQKKLGTALTGPQKETYDFTVHRYEFITQRQ